jgi:DNA-binding response OmpR family regulator
VLSPDLSHALGPEDASVVRFDDFEWRIGEPVVRVSGRHVPFTPREFAVFRVLVGDPGHVLSRSVIYRRVWGGDMPYRDRSVDVYVRKVRLKLGAAAPERDFIHTHFGFGYRFDPQAKPPSANITPDERDSG